MFVGPSYLSEALANLHEAIVKAGTGSAGGERPTEADRLSSRDVESAQSVGYWLVQAGLLDVGPESHLLVHQEKDSMKLQISLLHAQLEEKNHQILGMQSALQQLQKQQQQEFFSGIFLVHKHQTHFLFYILWRQLKLVV